MQDHEYFSGGVVIGRLRISFPTSLQVNSQSIALSFFWIRYTFPKHSIIAIEVKGHSKIVIHHTVHQYPERILFLTSNAKAKAQKIRWFLPNLPAKTNSNFSKRKGWPVRWQFILIYLIWWNSPLLVAHQFSELKEFPFSLVVVMSTFIGSLLVGKLPVLTFLIVAPGRHYGEIKHVVNLVSFLTGIISLAMVAGLIWQGIHSPLR